MVSWLLDYHISKKYNLNSVFAIFQWGFRGCFCSNEGISRNTRQTWKLRCKVCAWSLSSLNSTPHLPASFLPSQSLPACSFLPSVPDSVLACLPTSSLLHPGLLPYLPIYTPACMSASLPVHLHVCLPPCQPASLPYSILPCRLVFSPVYLPFFTSPLIPASLPTYLLPPFLPPSLPFFFSSFVSSFRPYLLFLLFVILRLANHEKKEDEKVIREQPVTAAPDM